MDPQRLIPGDATLIENIVNNLKAKGIFDQFRHECLADVDTKSSCQNLSQRVDGYTSKFLANETWHPDLNKNELRNKLRRNIDESGMITVGADHVVEQVINPKIHQLFLPKIVEVVHQYIKEQTSLCSKRPETCPSSNETTDSKTKTSISDPIADILSFTYSKSKPSTVTNSHLKAENVQQKQIDLPKSEKKREDKPHIPEKNASETLNESATTSVSSEIKPQVEKIKKEQEISQEVSKKLVKEEFKPEKKKLDDAKVQSSEVITPVEENKANTSIPSKPLVPGKRDHDKNKQKVKSSNSQKSSNSSNETKKPKKESVDKSSEKITKTKLAKSPKEPSSPTKSPSLVKTSSKEEKIAENSKNISSDSNSTKASDSPLKKSSKSNFNKIKHSKHKGSSEKNDKSKVSKLVEKSDQDSSNNEKATKSIHYSSSYDSSQGSDQEKGSSSNSKNEKQKHFSKSAKKEKPENLDKSDKTSSEKKKPKDVDEGMTKKMKNEKSSKVLEKLKEVAVGEAAKISSRSNSFGSTSSIGSSSNTSKDNLITNSDEGTESSGKDKKKRQTKEKKSCQNPDAALPPPPPPPPPSSSLISDATSSAEMSSMDDTTQSSCDSEASSSREISEGPLSDSELELKEIEQSTLNENILNVSTDSRNSVIEKIFLSSSSSEFEGFDSSPEKLKDDASEFQNLNDSDVEVSSVHTSDLSNYNDELSDDDFSINDSGIKKQLTLKEAQELIQNKALLQKRNKKSSIDEDKSVSNPASPQNKNRTLSSSSFLSGLENSPVKEYANDSDVSVSSVHTSDLSSFNDELSDDGLFYNESSSGRKKRLTLKEAEELIRNKAVLLDKIKNSPSESISDATPKTPDESSSQKTSLSSDEESVPLEPKRLLRRERKLNPRYASSEYTSIFNCKKETFITKQSSPVKNNSINSSVEQRSGKKESFEKSRLPEKSSVKASEDAVHQNKTKQSVEAKKNLYNSKISSRDEVSSNSIDMFNSDDVKSVVDKEKMFEINNKPADNSDADHLKKHVKLKVNNSSKLSINSNSLKRKLSFTESTPLKRPCSRSSVDSSSSELVPNENKPFNSDKQNLVEDKIVKDNKLKGSDLSGVIKKDLFSKQRSNNNNNGDVLGQKDHFPKNSYGRTTNTEKKTAESDSSKELNAL